MTRGNIVIKNSFVKEKYYLLHFCTPLCTAEITSWSFSYFKDISAKSSSSSTAKPWFLKISLTFSSVSTLFSEERSASKFSLPISKQLTSIVELMNLSFSSIGDATLLQELKVKTIIKKAILFIKFIIIISKELARFGKSLSLLPKVKNDTITRNLRLLYMEFFKKAFIGIGVTGSLLVLSFIGLIKMGREMSTQIQTEKESVVIAIDSRQVAYQPMLIAPYKSMDVFLSNEKLADFEFSSVAMSWEELIPEGTHIELEIRTKVGEKWSDWIETEEEEDPFVDHEDFAIKKYAMLATNPASAMQYRFILYGDGKSSPIARNIEYTFLKAGHTISLESAPKPQYSAAEPQTSVVSLVAGQSGIISRAQWGADESYRYLKDQTSEPNLIDVDPDWYEKFKNELEYSRVVNADENGLKYTWPLQYPQSVKKFIIHHTATTGNLDKPEQAIRDIYYYHAVTRGWGDIGYNYIVDPNGKVYEGRFGGEGVIGAHSGPGNNGSIGIAVLGNYETTPIPEDVITSISQFVHKKAKIHGIETDGSSLFRGKEMENIFGHRDIMSTQCPGVYLYAKIPVIGILAAINFEEKEKFVKDYDYQNRSDVYYIELQPDETREITLKLENIGKVNWDNKTYIVVNDNPDFTNLISFPGKEDVVLANMQESLVKPGETATFRFEIKAERSGKTAYMNIAPLINGTNKSDDYVILPVTVQQPVYKYEYLDGQFPDPLMKAGDTFNGSIRLKNQSNLPWENTGDYEVTLLSDAEDIKGTLSTAIVNPGETASFNFTFVAPKEAGYKKYTFTPKIKDGTFSSSKEISFESIVYDREYDAEVVSKTLVNDWERGSSYTLSMKLRNIGAQNWTKDKLQLFVLKEKDITLSDLSMQPTSAKPGEEVTVSFTVKVNDDAELTEKLLIARAKMNGLALNFVPATYKYNIKEKQFYSADSNGPNFRVKLGFSGDPEISGNGSFEIYSGDNLLATLNAGSKAKVTKESGKYRVSTDSGNFLKDQPIRFVPKSNAILQISNYENQPAWNPKLNDNEYRGNLEVFEDDGELVVINELPLEYYLKGLGEVSNTEETEKIKAIMIAARTYAKYYLEVDEKFPGKPYNLDDNPDVSQKYIGYGFEKRAPNVASAVEDTKGKIVTYNGELVKTPYFNQSDGSKTKSAEAVWGWTNTPWLVSVSDSACDGTSFLGHGVGLSGCGAHGMAVNGSNYEEILKHYYTNIQITDLY